MTAKCRILLIFNIAFLIISAGDIARTILTFLWPDIVVKEEIC